MMSVADVDSELAIDADHVAKAVNGAPRGVCPPGTDSVVGFVDVNIRKGKGISEIKQRDAHGRRRKKRKRVKSPKSHGKSSETS